MRPGDPIGRYTVVRELGRGGMGVVVVARDPALDREVAIKLLHPVHGDAALLERFRREAETAARLRHPGIVTVHEAGVDAAGRPFIVQELVEGESLQAALTRDGPPAPDEAVRIVRDLARALAHAHAHGVLHRDLKPANVLSTPDGRVLLADFGLAKDALSKHSLTRTGEVLGTADYMAPEQAEDGKRIDARADVYALGGVLYALLAGGPPFRGTSTLNVLAQVLEAAPPPPSRRRDGVPPALEALCLRCLQKRPDDRPATADAVADALDALLRSGMRARPAARARRLVALTLLVLAALALVLARRGGEPPAIAPPPPAPSTTPPRDTEPPRDAEPEPERLEGWRWVRRPRTEGPWPAPRLAAAALHVPGRPGGVAVLGGLAGGGALDEAWTWDGTTWTSARLADARYGAGAALLDGRVVVAGGRDGPRPRHGLTLSRELPGWARHESPNEPPPRAEAGLVSVDRSTCLLFGGRLDDGSATDELWEWRWTGWRLLDAPGRRPSPRHGAAVAYDAARRRLVVFGGEGPDVVLGDLWEWDAEGGWTRRDADGPAARTLAGLTYDGARCLLAGGRDAIGQALDDAWAWDGHRWRALAPAERPPARYGAAFAWDAQRQTGVLFGGAAADDRPLDDLWELVPPGWRWVQRTPAGRDRPAPRFAAGSAYDPRSGLTVVAGGWAGSAGDLDDLWAWDGHVWTPAGALPTPRHDPGLAIGGGRLVLQGGRLGEAWLADLHVLDRARTVGPGAPMAWSAAASELPRARHGFVHAPARGGFFVVGGTNPLGPLDEVHEWRDGTWTRHAPLPLPLASAGVVWDDQRQRLLVFGGTTRGSRLRGELLAWRAVDGAWTTLHDDAGGPGARTEPALAFDGARCLVFGGVTRDEGTKRYLDDLWIHEDGAWRRLRLTPAPSPRSRCTFVFDARRRVVVLFGGNDEQEQPLGDLWELQVPP